MRPGTVKRFFPEGEQQIIAGSPASFYYTRDHLGSVRELIDSSGTVAARYDYDCFGKRTKLSGNGETDRGFTGHTIHAASGLVLAPMRAYDPAVARWLSRDPIGESGGLNLYGYVGNSPTNRTAPLGLWAYFQPSTWFDGKGYQPGFLEDGIGQSAQAALDGLIPFGIRSATTADTTSAINTTE